MRHDWGRKLAGSKIEAGRFDLEIIILDRFGVLPYEGALYDQDPAFVDELREYLAALSEHEKKTAPKAKK